MPALQDAEVYAIMDGNEWAVNSGQTQYKHYDRRPGVYTSSTCGFNAASALLDRVFAHDANDCGG